VQTFGSTLPVHNAFDPSVHLLDPTYDVFSVFLSTPDLSLITVVSFTFSLGVEPLAHVVGPLTPSESQVAAEPSEHFGGFLSAH